MDSTICAISTSIGVGAISIIRVSGHDALNIVNKIFNGKDLTTVPTHTIHYGYIYFENEKVDEVLVSIMKSPKTFTTEDIVEMILYLDRIVYPIIERDKVIYNTNNILLVFCILNHLKTMDKK